MFPSHILSEEKFDLIENQINIQNPVEWKCHVGKAFSENKREGINKIVFKDRFFFSIFFFFLEIVIA